MYFTECRTNKLQTQCFSILFVIFEWFEKRDTLGAGLTAVKLVVRIKTVSLQWCLITQNNIIAVVPDYSK